MTLSVDGHIRMQFRIENARVLGVVVGASERLSHVTFVALVVDECVWWSGGRSTDVISLNPTAVSQWNDATESWRGSSELRDSQDARVLAVAFLAFATGMPLVIADSGALDVVTVGRYKMGITWWRTDVVTVTHETDTKGWAVRGRIEQRGIFFTFEVLLGTSHRVEFARLDRGP